MITKRPTVFLVICILCAVLFSGAISMAKASAEASSSRALVIEAGLPAAKEWLGFGWSKRDLVPFPMRWTDKLESDVWFEMEGPREDIDLQIVAAPMYVANRRQVVGVYANNRFVEEWICPHAYEFKEFGTTIPARFLKPGRNRIILRVGYLARAPKDPRELGLAVRTIRMTPVSEVPAEQGK